MSVVSQVRDLAVRVAQDVRSLREGKADLSVVARKAATETISGLWTFGTAPRFPTGDQPENPVLRNDGRLTDARDPKAHQHNASDITTGFLDPARLPAVTSEVRSGTMAAGLTPNAARSAGGTISDITVTGDATLGAPTNGANGQVLRYRFTNTTTAQRRFTFASAILPTTGTFQYYDIPAGKTLVCALERIESRGAWFLTAGTVG